MLCPAPGRVAIKKIAESNSVNCLGIIIHSKLKFDGKLEKFFREGLVEKKF